MMDHHERLENDKFNLEILPVSWSHVMLKTFKILCDINGLHKKDLKGTNEGALFICSAIKQLNLNHMNQVNTSAKKN